MSESFYHASRAEYIAGATVQGVIVAEHWRRRELEDPRYREVEDFLESIRPGSAPSRRTSCFAFGRLTDAAVYAKSKISWASESGEQTYRYYLVEMEIPYAAPLVLVDRAYKKLDSPEVLGAIAAEYWQAGPEWKFLEYLAPTMIVQELVALPDERELYGASWRHLKDSKLAKERWP